MMQKIIQIGNSTGIIIPKTMLDRLGLAAGSEIMIEEDEINQSLAIVKKGKIIKKTSITPKFIDLLEKVNENYGLALKELAEK